MVMRSMILTALGLFAIVMAPPSHSAFGAEATEARRVARLIAQLGSDQFTEREAATHALDAIGPPALEALRKATHDPDMEVQRRARTLVAKIAKRVERDRILAPKYMHLKYDDVRLEEAVADFSKQSGCTLVLNGSKTKWKDRRVTLDTGEVTFWEALDQFCQKAVVKDEGTTHAVSSAAASVQGRVTIQAAAPAPLPGGPVPIAPRMPIAAPQASVASMAYFPASGPRRIVLEDGKPPDWPTCIHRAVRFRAVQSEALKRSMRQSGDAYVFLEADTADLHLRRIVDVGVTEARDENGQILKAKSQEASSALNGNPPNLGAVQTVQALASLPGRNTLPVRLQPGDKPSKKLALFKGNLAVEVQTPTENLLSVDKLMQSANTEVKNGDGAYLKVLDASKAGNGLYHLRVQLQIPPTIVPSNEVVVANPRAAGRHGAVMRNTSVYGLSVYDDQGEPLMVRSTSSVARVFGNVATREYSLVFAPRQGQHEPAKLVFAGQRIVSVDIPYELKDVPLDK